MYGCLLEKGVCYDQYVLSTELLAFSLLHFVLQSSMMKRISFFWGGVEWLGVGSRRYFMSSWNQSTSASLASEVRA